MEFAEQTPKESEGFPSTPLHSTSSLEGEPERGREYSSVRVFLLPPSGGSTADGVGGEGGALTPTIIKPRGFPVHPRPLRQKTEFAEQTPKETGGFPATPSIRLRLWRGSRRGSRKGLRLWRGSRSGDPRGRNLRRLAFPGAETDPNPWLDADLVGDIHPGIRWL